MTKRQKRHISRELAAIASLRDSEIDISDIPEITDWSRAVVGTAYRTKKSDTSRVENTGPEFTRLPLPYPDALRFTGAALSETIAQTQQFTGANLAAMTSQQLIVEFVQGHTAAWEEFVRRFQKLIANVVVRACMRWGNISPETADDLTQEVYLKLWENDCQLLRRFGSRHENAFVGFLKLVVSNIVYDHFRVLGAMRAGGEEPLLSVDTAGSVDRAAQAEQDVLLEEINRLLETHASERDRAIFWLYYRQGLTTKEIATIPEFNLTVKGIESVIFRLTKTLRCELVQALPAHQSQRETTEILRETRSPRKKKD